MIHLALQFGAYVLSQPLAVVELGLFGLLVLALME